MILSILFSKLMTIYSTAEFYTSNSHCIYYTRDIKALILIFTISKMIIVMITIV